MPSRSAEMARTVAEVRQAITEVTNWRNITPPDAPAELSVTFIEGATGLWKITAARFKQAGRTGYDGAATNMTKGVILHLLPDMAEEAFRRYGATRPT